jgi:hypothetical protein
VDAGRFDGNAYASYRAAVKAVCDQHFRLDKLAVSTEDISRTHQTRHPMQGQTKVFRRPVRPSEALGNLRSSGRYLLERERSASDTGDLTEAAEDGTDDASSPSAEVAVGVGRKPRGPDREKIALLHAAYKAKHQNRVRKINVREKRLQKIRRNASERETMRKGKGARTDGTTKRVAPRSRRLRLKEQEPSTTGLQFHPQIVSKTLKLRLAEFSTLLAKRDLLEKITYFPPTSGPHILGNHSSNEGIYFRKTLMQALDDIDRDIRVYGYGLKGDFTPFYSLRNELDEWDIMKTYYLKPKSKKSVGYK